jgi:cyclophilin family peptidyl-prolyl cis-trans isomerase/HEAT repeat protein
MSRSRTARAVFACLAISSLAACAHSGSQQEPGGPEGGGEEQAEIIGWEAHHSLGDGRLVAMATGAPQPWVRARALRALARIQDVTTLDALLAALKDAEPSVRGEAAFAAGQLALSWEPLPDAARARLGEALREAEAGEKDARVRDTLLESLGKLATPDAVARLAERLEDAPLAGRAALALGVAARRGGVAVVAGVPLSGAEALLAADRPVEARYGGAYFLMAAKRPTALPALRRCLADADADVRGLCAKGFGDVGGPEDAVVLGRLLEDPVPRVAAEAARSLAKLTALCSGPCTALDALEALAPRAKRVARGMESPEAGGAKPPVDTLVRSAEGHALLAVAQQGLPAFGRPVLEALRLALADAERGAASDVAREDLAWLDCRMAAAMDRQTGTLDAVGRCGFDRVPMEQWLPLGLRELALSKQPGGAHDAVNFLRHADTRVRQAALAALEARPIASTEAVLVLRALVAGEDTVNAASAAAVLGKLKDTESLPGVEALAEQVPQQTDLAEPVAGALVALQGPAAEPRLREWLKHPHANVRRVAAEALTQLTGQPVRSEHVPLPPAPRRPSFAHNPPFATRGSGLVFRTDKGEFTVRLDAGEAPFTSGNLVDLASKGFFNGIPFHRVVPDFVAQGGDPRGDGEGGPGYAIRCELNRRPYRRGTVGMALSGKDTGGSQFFITHAPAPHLDGRYTALGEVVEGMDVVDALLEGDVIREVRKVQLAP